jgi:hypothetical protein
MRWTVVVAPVGGGARPKYPQIGIYRASCVDELPRDSVDQYDDECDKEDHKRK